MYFEWPLPLAGKSAGIGVSYQEEGTSGYLNNVRPRDVLESRLRIGQRSGLKKAYSQQIGGEATPVNWLGSITVFD